MEGQEGSQNEHLMLANKIFLLTHPDVQDIKKVRFKDEVLSSLKSDFMAPVYETLATNGVVELDQSILDSMRQSIEDELKKLDEKVLQRKLKFREKPPETKLRGKSVTMKIQNVWLFFGFLLSISLLISPILANYAVHHQDQGLNGNAESRDLSKEYEQNHEVHCSRERSRVAWEIIDKYLMPFVERERYVISTSCRLHPDIDLFRDQEQHKIKADVNEWQCGYCKKSFLSEVFLDQHFDSRHNNLLNFTGCKCLADLCGALHCDHVLNSKSPRAKCNPAAVARNLHLCESLADACFPVNRGSSASRLHEFFLQQFCHAHTCSRGNKPFSRGGRKETNVLYIAGSILTLMLLPLFYVLVCLHQSETRKNSQELKRISKPGRKAKPM